MSCTIRIFVSLLSLIVTRRLTIVVGQNNPIEPIACSAPFYQDIDPNTEVACPDAVAYVSIAVGNALNTYAVQQGWWVPPEPNPEEYPYSNDHNYEVLLQQQQIILQQQQYRIQQQLDAQRQYEQHMQQEQLKMQQEQAYQEQLRQQQQAEEQARNQQIQAEQERIRQQQLAEALAKNGGGVRHQRKQRRLCICKARCPKAVRRTYCLYLWCGLCGARRRLVESNNTSVTKRALRRLQYQTLAQLAEVKLRELVSSVSDPACQDFLQRATCEMQPDGW